MADNWVMHPYEEQRYVPLMTYQENDNAEADRENSAPLDHVLPDDILERILSLLPVVSIFRARAVCKRWNHVVNSERFLLSFTADLPPQKPWYFMFTGNEDPVGFAYDPILRKWYGIDLPCIETTNWFIASSFGLVCFMDNDNRTRLFVCNPITKDWTQLRPPSDVILPDYSALSVSVDRRSHDYTVTLIQTKQVPGDFQRWDLSIHIYDSDTRSWVSPAEEVLVGWRGGDESIICDGVLYCLIYSTGVVNSSETRHALIMYDLNSQSSHMSLFRTSIPVPCSLTCGRLMNLNEKLVMVGGIGKPDRPDIIKGIGIWELHKREWREVSRMPHRYFQGFGEFDDVFASSGTDDLIYIQSYGAPALLAFDMNQKQWKWALKCPVTKRFPLQLFTGFSFEPRLEVNP
ncbi:F-box/kelch-repeat protein [Acorus calamus]|uniref:F-box/kelch-repeat protein n=1 Tax=Acorus calamus TaxID=4465 RepID=A0AAV9F5N2_ACOCL|nr:F-box/kelch-repeat protein [Acorus calamus]